MGLRLLLRGDVARLADAAKRSLGDGGLLEIRSDDAAAVDALPARPHLGRSAELKDHSAGAFHQRVVEGDFPGISWLLLLCRLQTGLLLGCLFHRFPSHSPRSNLSQPRPRRLNEPERQQTNSPQGTTERKGHQT